MLCCLEHEESDMAVLTLNGELFSVTLMMWLSFSGGKGVRGVTQG